MLNTSNTECTYRRAYWGPVCCACSAAFQSNYDDLLRPRTHGVVIDLCHNQLRTSQSESARAAPVYANSDIMFYLFHFWLLFLSDRPSAFCICVVVECQLSSFLHRRVYQRLKFTMEYVVSCGQARIQPLFFFFFFFFFFLFFFFLV